MHAIDNPCDPRTCPNRGATSLRRHVLERSDDKTDESSCVGQRNSGRSHTDVADPVAPDDRRGIGMPGHSQIAIPATNIGEEQALTEALLHREEYPPVRPVAPWVSQAQRLTSRPLAMITFVGGRSVQVLASAGRGAQRSGSPGLFGRVGTGPPGHRHRFPEELGSIWSLPPTTWAYSRTVVEASA